MNVIPLPYRHSQSSYVFDRQSQAQRPILELPPIPHWGVGDADPVLELPPLPFWGAELPDEQLMSWKDDVAIQYPKMTAISQQQPQPPPGSSLEDTSSMLGAFGCEFHPALGYILCKRHEVLVPVCMLKSHLSQEHKDNFSAFEGRKLVIQSLISSLKTHYGLDPAQGYPEAEWKLLYPIHKRVYAGKCCPLCPTFFLTNHDNKYSTHFSSKHNGEEKVKWSRLQFFHSLHQPFGSQEGTLYLIPSQDGSHHSQVASSVEKKEGSKLSQLPSLDFPPPGFCQELGFVSWIKPLDQQQRLINYLTATPGTDIPKSASGTKAQLEKMLLRIHIFLLKYLSSGQEWLHAYHTRLQDIVGKRYYSNFILF